MISKSRIAELRKGALVADTAGVAHVVPCLDLAACDRTFLTYGLMLDHAEAVHTFSDIEELVRDAVREKYNRDGDRTVTPPVPYRYAWVRDLSTDWVVFEMNESSANRERNSLYKASYSIVDGNVTLGEPTEVVRKTVYEPVAQPATGA